MTVESATYISDLNSANPGASDVKSEGDDHMRLIKSTIKATFPHLNNATQLYTDGTNVGVGGAANTDVLGVYGQLSVGFGVVGSYQINGRGTGDMEIVPRNAASNLNLYYGNGTLGAKLTSAGVWTLPGNLQPAFNAQRITSDQTLAASTVTTVIPNSENFDQAANFDGTTGIFTAPVAGLYVFTLGAFLQNPTGSSVVLNDLYLSLNNATAVGASRYDFVTTTVEGSTINAGSNQFCVGGSVVVRMAAADTARVKVDVGAGAGSLRFKIGSTFSGYLLG